MNQTEQKPIIKKILESGLVDKATIQMMEKWGTLPPGSSDLVKEDALKDATQDVLLNLASDLSDIIEKEHTIRETALDLERIRWPATVTITNPEGMKVIATDIPSVMDRMGRYYFRLNDVPESWLVPGYLLVRRLDSKRVSHEYITEYGKLYSNDKPVCFQVSTKAL